MEWNALHWSVDENDKLTISGEATNGFSWTDAPWKEKWGTKIISAEVTVKGLTSADHMFSGYSNLISADMSDCDTSRVTSMASMFEGCSNLSSVDVSGWDMSGVTNAGNMFGGCSSLATIKLPKYLSVVFCKLPYYDNHYDAWKDDAGITYIQYMPATTGESFTITRLTESEI